jgi:hypothetical protein
VERRNLLHFFDRGRNMTEAKMFGFYTINAEYLKFLHDKDSEVYYNKEYHTLKKLLLVLLLGWGKANILFH